MTSAELLELFNDLTGRPQPPQTDSILDTKKYTWLSRAQDEVVTELARIKPSMLYPKSTFPTMSTTDNKVFTFGLDTNGDAIIPIGQVQIYRRLTDIPKRPLVPGYDYLDEVSQIRWPSDRTFSGTLYYRGVVFPAKITAAVIPSLLPGPANELTAIRAAQNFAEGGNIRNAQLADRMRVRWKERFPVWCLTLKRQYSDGGALVARSLVDILTPA